MADEYPFLKEGCYAMQITFPGFRAIPLQDPARLKLRGQCRKIFPNAMLLEDEAEAALLLPDIRGVEQFLEEVRFPLTICLSARGDSLEQLQETYQAAQGLAVYHLLNPEMRLLTKAVLSGLISDFVVPHREFEKLGNAIGHGTQQELQEQMAALFEKQRLKRYQIGYTLAVCDTLYRTMREAAAAIPQGSALEFSRISQPVSFPSMREYLLYANSQLLSLHAAVREQSLGSRDHYAMEQAMNYIRKNYARPLTLAVVSNEVSLNYAYFSNLFRKHTGKTFSEYLRDVRMEEAKRLLARPDIKISEAAAQVGYDNYKSFSRAFKDTVGMIPAQYQKQCYQKKRREDS